MMLIDFDWGTKSGEASFPTVLLNKDLTGGKEIGNMSITKEHDVRVFTAALEKLKPIELVDGS